MKTNGARIVLIRGLLLVLLSLYFIVVFGQTSSVISFNASKKIENISIQWVLAPANNLSTVILERKTADTGFHSIAEFWVNFDGNKECHFNYTDKKVKAKSPQYRLKCINVDGEVQYSNTVLSVDSLNKSLSLKTAAAKVSTHAVIERSLLADNSFTAENIVEHLKYLLLVQIQERENNLL